MPEAKTPGSESSGAKGSLTIAGVGITAIAHVTLETIGHVREADIVFHNFAGVQAEHIRGLNSNCVCVSTFYGNDKYRMTSYTQMAEVVLRELRAGRRVVFLFQGHPTVLNYAADRALAIAKAEGMKVRVIPGVSSIDAMLADLQINVHDHGCQILEAKTMLVRPGPIATNGHLIVLMGGRVGDQTDGARFGGGHAKVELLFERLIQTYGENHQCFLYWCAGMPTDRSKVLGGSLKECDAYLKVKSLPTHWTLYLPPLELNALDRQMADRMDDLNARSSNSMRSGGVAGYGPLEHRAIEELDEMPMDPAETSTRVDALTLKLMTKVATSPSFGEASPWLTGARFDGLETIGSCVALGDDAEEFFEKHTDWAERPDLSD